jgi:hypothetical protein
MSENVGKCLIHPKKAKSIRKAPKESQRGFDFKTATF